MSQLSQLVRIRDVVRHGHFELGPEVPVLRVPYDAFQPAGAVQLQGELVAWVEKGTSKTGRVAPTRLGDTHPGERVLVHFADATDDVWWLCEVERVDGSDGGA